MLTLTLQSVRIGRASLFLAALLFIPMLTATAYAQIGEGAGLGDSGIRGAANTIQGNIFYPSGRRLDRRIQIRISSIRGLDYSTMSDENGSFNFRRLPGGTYYITAEPGNDYLPVNETVSVIEQSARNSNSGQTYMVQIQLQLRPTNGGGGGVLNVAFAGVPQPALDLYQKALKSAETGDNKKAIELLKQAINIHPQFTLAYNEMGVQYFRMGQLDNAIDALRQAIKIDPNAFSPRLNCGVVLFYKKQYQDADAQLTRALEINETSARAHLFLGRTFIRLNDFAKAEKEFLRAVALGGSPDINEAHRFLGGIYNEQGNYARAIEELETYLKLVPNTRDADQIRQIIKELRNKMSASRS
ncbi:MAG: hypothetical protein AUG51_06510 [Acidobacteria bacterium 13_1_20CM_3_53_8]|nr:MAG: hypothetical protein AUG51_06510 [Acidobacteria bacterium 13_1_20CM_3_53_8]